MQTMRASQPGLVSVLMPAYNAEAYIGQAIESILGQSYTNWELIIVNDGSKDQTESIVKQIADTRVRLISQENGGEAAARNTGLKYMRGEFIAFLDADDVFLSHHLDVTVRYLVNNSERGGVYTDGFHINHAGERLIKLSARRRGPFEGHIFEQVIRSQNVFGPPLCIVLRSKPVIERGLLFDPSIAYGTDWDFFARFSEQSLFGYIDDCTCLYRVHSTNMTLQLDNEKRKKAWTICRKKAIKFPGFNNCSIDIRWFVFYDLLINLLNGYPDRQKEIICWSEFNDLPPEYRAKLLRLMANKAILDGRYAENVRLWLDLSRSLDPKEIRSKIIFILYRVNPVICHIILRVRYGMNWRIKDNKFDLNDLLD